MTIILGLTSKSLKHQIQMTMTTISLLISIPGTTQFDYESDLKCVVIGRGDQCDLKLPDPMVSKQHARLRIRDGKVFIEDLGSSNGTFLNGERIVEPREFQLGDTIRIGFRIAITLRPVESCEAASSAFDYQSSVASPKVGVEYCLNRFDDVATKRGVFNNEERLDDVDCSVFAPPMGSPEDSVLVQVFSYLAGDVDKASALAKQFDTDAEHRGFTSLGTRIRRGSLLTFEFVVKHGRVEESVKSVQWRGKPVPVQFELDLPSAKRTLICRIVVSQDSVPIGQIAFKIKVQNECEEQERSAGRTETRAKRFHKAFVSYASENRTEVLKRTQMLKSVGIDVFQDILSLEPGQNWQSLLYQNIEQSDVMFLFWSAAAKASPWVEKEWRFGLSSKGDDYIQPVVIEGPPVVPPPNELSHLHFSDKILYFITDDSPER